jgi:hypothetical protein
MEDRLVLALAPHIVLLFADQSKDMWQKNK